MRRLLTVLPTTLLLLLAVTSPAYATFADWLDKIAELSGPGPFTQWAGAAVDLVCWEGQWWKDPGQDDRALSAQNGFRTNVLAIRTNVLTALGPAVDNPFVIARVVSGLAQNQPSKVPAPLAPLLQLYSQRSSDEREDILEILRQRARRLFWELRERVLSTPGRAEQEARLQQEFQRFNADPNDTDDAMRIMTLSDSRRIIRNPFCVGDLRKPRRSFGIYAAYFSTSDLPGEYVYSSENLAKSPTIRAIPVTGTFKLTTPRVSEAHPIFLRSHDLGVSAGVMIFTGERLPEVNLTPYFEIPRVIFRPLAMVACERGNGCPGAWTGWDLLEVEFVGKVIPGFTAQDWGAISGPSSGWHWQWALRVGVSYKFSRDQTPAKLVP